MGEAGVYEGYSRGYDGVIGYSILVVSNRRWRRMDI